MRSGRCRSWPASCRRPSSSTCEPASSSAPARGQWLKLTERPRTARAGAGVRRGLRRHAAQLTQLDGVDIHDSTRLETEGITDIPSLASADLVSLMISTRLPGRSARRLDGPGRAHPAPRRPRQRELDPRVNRAAPDRHPHGVRRARTPPPRACPPACRRRSAQILRDGRAEDRALTPDALAAMIRREPAMRRDRPVARVEAGRGRRSLRDDHAGHTGPVGPAGAGAARASGSPPDLGDGGHGCAPPCPAPGGRCGAARTVSADMFGVRRPATTASSGPFTIGT